MTRVLSFPLSAVLIVCFGCDSPGGGISARPDIAVKVSELEDEDVPTVDRGEAGSLGIVVPVLTPNGQVILPPALRDPPVDDQD